MAKNNKIVMGLKRPFVIIILINLFLVQILVACQSEIISAETPLLVATVDTSESKSAPTIDDGPQFASKLSQTEESLKNPFSMYLGNRALKFFYP